MESHEHPAVITRISRRYGGVHIYARYVWSAHTEPDWLLGTFPPTALLPKAVDKPHISNPSTETERHH
jgi:hypothetical protein